MLIGKKYWCKEETDNSGKGLHSGHKQVDYFNFKSWLEKKKKRETQNEVTSRGF